MTARADTLQLITEYYDAFNQGDSDAMLAMLHHDIVHHVNQGNARRGQTAFSEFCAHMNRCYRERLSQIVIMANDDGTRAAAEFIVHGEYLSSDEGLPPAQGQRYELPAGAFFTVQDGKISRISTYYNLNDWIQQVSN